MFMICQINTYVDGGADIIIEARYLSSKQHIHSPKPARSEVAVEAFRRELMG